MSEHSERYLAFVDYLGTRALYGNSAANGQLIQDRRYELEHGIHLHLQRAIAERRIEIGVFSDTVLIAGNRLEDVLSSSAKLLMFSLGKTLYRANPADVRLLRGGISHGSELRSGYLKAGNGVSVIPFFDSSLAFAFELEDVRRGSRLFLDANIGAGELGLLSQYTFLWNQITGHGRPVTDIREFLWPAFINKDTPDALISLFADCFKLWRTFLAAAPTDPETYRATLYHFDETIKTIVRSFVTISDPANIESSMHSLVGYLPHLGDLMNECNIRYIWGIWFQIAYVITRHGFAEHFRLELSFMLKELKRRNYLDNFIAEIDYPDYEILRPLIGFK